MERMEAKLSWVGTNFSISLVTFLQLAFYVFIDCFVLELNPKIQLQKHNCMS